MAVVKHRRNLSALEFYRNAIYLRKCISFLLLKDFGIRDKVRKPEFYKQHMNEEDAKIFDEIIEKYDETVVLEHYPKWVIEHARETMLVLTRNLVMNITYAYSIYPQFEDDFLRRRKFIDYAIGNCEYLLQEMQWFISIIPINVNKLMPFVDMIEKELNLLKDWRNSDKKRMESLRNKSSDENNNISEIKTPFDEHHSDRL